MTLKAIMTWGGGADVTLDLEDGIFVLYEHPSNLKRMKHGTVSSGSMQLTAAEALQLSNQLSSAAYRAMEMDQMCIDHDEAYDLEHKNTSKNYLT